jgi:hypothetical protein
MVSLSDYVSMITLQDIVLDSLVNTSIVPLLAAYGPVPDIIAMVEQVRSFLMLCTCMGIFTCSQ